MKTNENEPQKAKLERERELNEFEEKRQYTTKLVKKGVNHGKHGRHEKKGNHRMKTNENEPQKATMKRERELNKFEAKR